MEANTFPYEITELEPDLNEKLMKCFTGQPSGFVRVGQKGYFLPRKYKEDAEIIYNMNIRSTDVFVSSYPRSGTTWIQELVWLIANDVDIDQAKAMPLSQRFPFLDMHFLFEDTLLKQAEKKFFYNIEETRKDFEWLSMPITKLLEINPSPRFIKTHLPMSLLPPDMLDTANVVFVARDPRDVAVSFYHHNRLNNIIGYNGDFKTYWNFFINDLILYAPFFDLVKEAWAKRHNPHMLFLFYEDLNKDLPGGLRRVATFLGKELTEPQVSRLCEHLNIDNFKQNKAVNLDSRISFGMFKAGEEPFIRKGKSGSWREYFDAEMTRQAERWMADNLRGTDLRFPE